MKAYLTAITIGAVTGLIVSIFVLPYLLGG